MKEQKSDDPLTRENPEADLSLSLNLDRHVQACAVLPVNLPLNAKWPFFYF